MIRVLFAEDQTIVRRGIVSLLGLVSDIRVAAEAADGSEALELILKTRPDVALLDIRLPKLSGIEVLERLSQNGSPPPTMFLTAFDEDLLFFQALRAGARGFLLKDVSLERLSEAIRTVAAGGNVLLPGLTERVIRIVGQSTLSFEAVPQPEQLTPRERDVLRLIAGGYSNREIAAVLHMSEGSIKNHTSNILMKLGTRDRTRAVFRGIQLGYL